MRARGGTRTAFPPLQTLGNPENIGNPAQSGTGTTQSKTQSVDIVHTSFWSFPEISERCRILDGWRSWTRGWPVIFDPHAVGFTADSPKVKSLFVT